MDSLWWYILIVSTSLEEHMEYLRLVFDILREQQLYANLATCTIFVDKVVFLGFDSSNCLKLMKIKLK